MLEDIRSDIQRLMSAYETQRAENLALRDELSRSKEKVEAYGKQIEELNRQIDTLRLQSAFTGTPSDNEAARKKVDRLIKEIDRCISMMEA